ncbi:MAG: hypothetical protein ACJAQ4_001361 [Cryomorphaceae bacterium]
MLIIVLKKWSAKVAKISSVARWSGTFEYNYNRLLKKSNQALAMASSFIFGTHQIIEWTSL